MARRNLLHKNKIDGFIDFLNKHYIEILPCKGSYEVLRFRFNGKIMIIYDGKSQDHYSVMEKAIPVVKRYLTEKNKTVI